jgi:putative restriction endonuclease
MWHSSPSRSPGLDAAIEYAQLNDDLFALMQDNVANLTLQHALLHHYFPNAPLASSPAPYGQLDMFTDITDKILHESPAAYRTEIAHLLAADDDEEVFLRGSLFKREVPKVYDHRCAISGMRIVATANIQMVDACHIMPFAESHDDTISNGIALSPSLHRAFDRGLISISSDHRVLYAGIPIMDDDDLACLTTLIFSTLPHLKLTSSCLTNPKLHHLIQIQLLPVQR